MNKAQRKAIAELTNSPAWGLLTPIETVEALAMVLCGGVPRVVEESVVRRYFEREMAAYLARPAGAK